MEKAKFRGGGGSEPQAPEPIDKKIGVVDYVGDDCPNQHAQAVLVRVPYATPHGAWTGFPAGRHLPNDATSSGCGSAVVTGGGIKLDQWFLEFPPLHYTDSKS